MISRTKWVAIVCPCCKEQKTEENLHHLLKWRKQYNIPALGIEDDYVIEEEEKLRWACDTCIKTEEVILANPEKQDYSIYPYFVYLDIGRKCNSCDNNYVYTKEEQLFWYEELGNNYWSRANNCLTCRLDKRKGNEENNKLTKLIMNLDESNIGELSQIVETYLEMDKLEKAKFYLSKLRKTAKKHNEDYSVLEAKVKKTI